MMRVTTRQGLYVESAREEGRDTHGKGPKDIGAPSNGNVWRIGNPERPYQVDYCTRAEIANLEAMKMRMQYLHV